MQLHEKLLLIERILSYRGGQMIGMDSKEFAFYCKIPSALNFGPYKERIDFLCGLIKILQGAYNEMGIRQWFERERSQLGMKSPFAIFTGSDWLPGDPEPQKVLELAQALNNQSS